ncbi:MAG: HNH endonuclease [Planctomycetaceae bacterium]|nr:HNH endonuclease [Planctomycetaceae bacterium]
MIDDRLGPVREGVEVFEGQVAAVAGRVQGGQDDELGRETTYAYDALDRLTSVTLPDPDGAGPLEAPFVGYEYDKASNLRFVTDPLGNVTEYVYDNLDRLVTAIEADPDGGGPLEAPQWHYEYDDAGQLLAAIDPLGRETTYDYDRLGRVITVTQPDPDAAGPQTAPMTAFTYDAANNLLSTTDPLGHVTTYAYDNLGRLLSVTQPDPDAAGPLTAPVTTYTYDAVGNLLSLKDPVNNTTTWTYDNLDRVTVETNPLSKTRTFKYDAVNNVTEQVDRLGRKTEYVYDNRYRNTSEKWYDGATLVRTLSFTYNAASELTAASDPAASYGFTYDGLGRVTSETQTITGLAPQLQYQSKYDAASNRTELLALIDGAADFKNNYVYDSLNRLTGLTQQSGGSGPGTNVVAEKRVDFSYNAASQFDKITRYADLGGFEFVANTFYAYDGMGRLTKLLHTEDATAPGSGWGTDPLAGYQFTYDAASRITSINSFADGLTNYTYDRTDQLTAADHTGMADEAYAYDENGNRTMAGYSTTANNQLTSDGTFSYTYDDEGNRLTKTRISTGEKEEYAWDHRNRLTGVKFKDAGGTVLKTVLHSYDAFNRWIKRSVDADGPGSGAAVDTFFSWQAGQINLQFDDDGDLSHRYLWNPATIDQILADESVSSLLSAGEVLWPLSDHLGTPRDLASYDDALDETTIANHRVYNSFGLVTSETNSSVTTIVGFTGAIYEAATGLNYHRARWLDLATGRWMSEDPIGFSGGDANLGRYVENGATSATDPSGLKPKLPKGLKHLVNVDKDTAELVLQNGKRIKIRNAKFIDSCVSLDDLETLTKVSKDKIERLRKEYGDDLTITFDKYGQPDFSKWKKARVRIPNPGASDYADKAWEQLKEDDLALYNELIANKDKYDWHHAADGSLQLIDRDLHSAFQHTGFNSVLQQLGGVACMMLMPAGVDKLMEGKPGEALRDAAYDAAPQSWLPQGITAYWSWLYDWAYDDLNGLEAQARQARLRKRILP